MPFEKFFLCSRNVFILGGSHTSTIKIRKKCSESRTLFWGDCPRLPRLLSWKRSRALRQVWHKPERMLEARAFFAFPETKESKTAWRLCSSLTICILIVEVFNSMRTQLLWTSEYPPCIWWYVWGENRRTSVSGKWYETQGKYAGFPLSRSYPYDCVDLSDIPDGKFTLDIVNKITPKRSEAIRRARIPSQYKRFWVL